MITFYKRFIAIKSIIMKIKQSFYLSQRPIYLIAFWLILGSMQKANAQSDPKKIQIIMIGAHPDDCDQDGGGTAAIFASMGHAVKFVSVTNGDAGHQTEGGGALAKRR